MYTHTNTKIHARTSTHTHTHTHTTTYIHRVTIDRALRNASGPFYNRMKKGEKGGNRAGTGMK